MASRSLRVLFCAVSLAALTISGGPAAALELQPCRIAGSDNVRTVDAECGRLEIAENPERLDGRTINLFVARVPAVAPTPAADPLVLIQGGPGGSSVELYVAMRDALERIRSTREILLVDQRGTGQSNPMFCPLPDTEPLDFDPELSARMSRECLAELDGDPRFYTTSVAVRDLDAVRSALGYEQLNLYGVSYGSRVALHYLRRYEDRVRSLIIDGVAPPSWNLGPDVARFGQDALDLMFARCSASSVCARRFGDLEAKHATLARRLAAAPAIVNMAHPVTGEIGELAFAEPHLVLVTRMLSYQRESLALLPLLIDLAYEGNLQPMAAQAQMVGESLYSSLAMGMHNSVVCTEDLPFLNTSAFSDLRTTYMGVNQVEVLQAICREWPAGLIDEGFKQAVTSAVPTLLLSGEVDPVTPPANAELAAATLSNQQHIVAPGQGHGVLARGCIPRLAAEFVEAADAAELDASCVERMGPIAFFHDLTGPLP